MKMTSGRCETELTDVKSYEKGIALLSIAHTRSGLLVNITYTKKNVY